MLCRVAILVSFLAAALTTVLADPGPWSPWPANPEGRIVVKFVDEAGVRLRASGLVSTGGGDMTKVRSVLTAFGNPQPHRVFARREVDVDRNLQAAERRSGRDLADLNGYYEFVVGPEAAADFLAALRPLQIVQVTYPAPTSGGPPAGPVPTPDFETGQGYLDPAPGGIDAREAWTRPGGRGEGVLVVDIEQNWRTTHEDLQLAQPQVLCFPLDPARATNHGTAVLGEIFGSDNGLGVTGIVPMADAGLVTWAPLGMTITFAAAIECAAAQMQPGDVMLVEIQSGSGTAIEVTPAEFDAIAAATAAGISVVEAAGNGAFDLDATNLGLAMGQQGDSGAIIVGAGVPPGFSQPDRSRLSFSSFGRPVNLQAWGLSVTTTGYGSLFDGGGDENRYYTGTFGGTSSAAPMVAGAVAAVQGVQQARGGPPYDPEVVRRLLIDTGTPQAPGPFPGPIGPRPDLRAALEALPDLFITNVEVLDLPPFGNGDGILDPGETATLVPTLKNFGPDDATSVRGTLGSDASWVRVTGAEARWPDLPSGAQSVSQDPHPTVTLQPDAPCGSSIRLTFGLTGAPYAGSVDFDLRVGRDQQTYGNSASAVAIPNGQPSGVTSTLQIAQPVTISEIYAGVLIEHQDIGELRVTIESPASTAVTLHDHGLPGNANLFTMYDRRSVPSGPGNFGMFQGQSGQGQWRLHVVDDQATATPPGTIDYWDVMIYSKECVPLSCAVLLPPAMGDSLRLDKSVSDVVFDWDSQPGAANYRVWRSALPMFDTESLVGQTATTTVVDSKALLNPPPIEYYQLRAVNSCKWEGP